MLLKNVFGVTENVLPNSVLTDKQQAKHTPL